MALDLQKEPTRMSPVDDPTYNCRYVAAHNPIYFEWIRKDNIVTYTEIYGANDNLTFRIGDTTGYEEDGYIYANTNAINGIFVISQVIAPNLIVTTQENYVVPSGDTSGYLNNLTGRKNYYIEIELSDKDDLQLALLQATPDTTGKVGIDISGAMQSYLSNEDDFEGIYVSDLHLDTSAHKKFKYKTKENWTDSENSWSDLSNMYIAVNGAFQVAHKLNGNYADYYLGQIDTKGKFISDFEELTVWDGYNIDLSFLYPETLPDPISNPIEGRAYYYGFNDALVYSNVFYGFLIGFENNTFIRWKIPVIGSLGSLRFKYMIISIDGNTGTYVQPIKCNIISGHDIPCNPIYLQWLGELGNRSYFLFNDLYNETMEVESKGTFQKAYDEIDTLSEISNWFNKDAYKKIQLGADGLTRTQIEGIKTLLKSPKVSVIDPITFERIGVLVENGTFNIGRGNDNLFKVEFVIVYPKQFGQSA
jgi:hypothetical protein